MKGKRIWEQIKKYMESLINKFIDNRFGNYKILDMTGYLVLYNQDEYVLGIIIYERKRFHYVQNFQGDIMDMFNLSMDEVNEYMKKWVANTFDEHVIETDAVFGL